MQTRTRNALGLLALGAALGGGVAWWARSRPPAPTAVVVPAGALAAIPGDALLVGSADLRALRASPVGAPFFREGREIRGVGKIRDVCGFDPVDSLDEIAIAVPAAGDAGDLGLAGSGAIQADAIVTCAKRVIEARGGRPVVTPVGSFSTVRDTSAPSGSEIAVRPGGPVLLGGAATLRAMIDAADGRAPSVPGNEAHGRVARLAGGRAARLTMVLTPEQRRQIADELASAGAPEAPAASILSAGLGVDLGPEVAMHAVVACAAAPACAALGERLRAARDARAEDLAARVSLIGTILQRVDLTTEGEALHLRLKLPAADVASLVEGLLELRARSEPPPPPVEPPPGEPPPGK